MEQDVPLLRSIAGWMLLKARIILSFHSPLNPACREMRTVPSVAAGRNYCRGLSGHTVAAYGNVDALMLCSLAHSIITVFGSSRGKKQCVSNLFSIPTSPSSVQYWGSSVFANTTTLLAVSSLLSKATYVTCLSLAAPLYLEWQHPGGCLLHADPVEHPAHLLVRQHGCRQVHDPPATIRITIIF